MVELNRLGRGVDAIPNAPNISPVTGVHVGHNLRDELRTAVGTYDTEEIDRDEIKESDLSYAVDIDSDTDEVSEVFVCAPKEVAEDIIRDEYGMFVTAHYRNVENDDDEV